MLITKEQQEAWVSQYLKENHSSEECIGFVDGINKTLDFVSKNIGNNNNWVKIEKKSDLPKERSHCWFLDKHLGPILGEFLNNSKEQTNYILANATHYKIIKSETIPI